MKLDIHYFLSSKYAQWVVLGFISLFSLLILGEFSTLFSISPPPVPRPTLPHTNTPKVKPDLYHAILYTPLFGVYVPNDLDEEHVKKSSLHLTVVGILLADKEKDSQVIIKSSRGEENTYKINDTIPGGAVIKRITAEGILVEQNGTLESLSFPKNNLIFEPAAKPLQPE